MIKADMAYFRKVTTNGKSVQKTSASDAAGRRLRNSVIMGRKTYESIPEKFRPLAGRTNVIVTRGERRALAEAIVDGLRAGPHKQLTEGIDFTISENDEDGTIKVEASKVEEKLPEVVLTGSVSSAADVDSEEICCIGGAEIYNLFLKDKSLRPRLRILQTEIQKLRDEEEFECDTFWSETLEESEGWLEADTKEVVAWTGVEVPQDGEQWAVDEKVGVRIRVRGWQRKGA